MVQPSRFTRRQERGLLRIGRHWPGASERGSLGIIAGYEVKPTNKRLWTIVSLFLAAMASFLIASTKIGSFCIFVVAFWGIAPASLFSVVLGCQYWLRRKRWLAFWLTIIPIVVAPAFYYWVFSLKK